MPHDAWLTFSRQRGDSPLRVGAYRKVRGKDNIAEMTVFLEEVDGDVPLFDPLDNPTGGYADASGMPTRWRVDFSSSDHDAMLLLEADEWPEVTGTIRTTTGDYGYLSGSFEGDRLRLATFDGAHAFLFDATLNEAGQLVGDFWSGNHWHETWTATPDADMELPDPFTLTKWVGGVLLSDIRFPDVDGNVRSLADREFAGDVRIIEVFGTWCPNCRDATRELVELKKRYERRANISIVGLAFEVTGDFETDAARVKAYSEQMGVTWPVLIAGTNDKAEASKKFPLIDKIRSYPTTIFMDESGIVHAVHQGFNGPATGEAYEKQQAEFHRIIDGILRTKHIR